MSLAPCGCKGECFNATHPHLTPQRACQRPGVDPDEYSRGDPMIPRIVVRDGADALFIVLAIRTHMNVLLAENLQEARFAPGEKQMALQLAAIETTRYACDLMDSITESVITEETGD